MASLFGSVAKRVGSEITEISTDKRKERIDYAEEQRQIQLEKQRMAHQSKLLDKRIAADDKRAKQTAEANRLLEQDRQTYDTSIREADRTASMNEAELRAETDILTTMMGVYISMQKDGVARGNGWTTKQSNSIDMETGQPITTYTATHEGRTYQQIGDKMFDAGGPTDSYPYKTVDEQRAAEAKLFDGTVSMQKFKDDFGYVPVNYVFGETAKGDFGSFMKKNQIRLPLLGIGVGDRRNTGGDGKAGEYNAPGKGYGEPSSQASKELRELEEREGRSATPEEMNDIIRRHRERAGKPEYPEDLNKFSNPYQESGGGETSQWGETVIGSSGKLSQGQAAAGELEQGGQLDQTVATGAAQPAQPPAQTDKPELDDAGAAEVSSSVSSAFGKIAEGFKDLMTAETPYGQ